MKGIAYAKYEKGIFLNYLLAAETLCILNHIFKEDKYPLLIDVTLCDTVDESAINSLSNCRNALAIAIVDGNDNRGINPILN